MSSESTDRPKPGRKRHSLARPRSRPSGQPAGAPAADPLRAAGPYVTGELPVEYPTPSPGPTPGPLRGVRVVELANPRTAFAGKLLADAGADVIVVEPPDGAEQRFHGPFAEDAVDHDMSLAWWAENTSKRSVVCDLDTGPGRQFFRQMVAAADVLLEAERPGRLRELGIDYTDLTGKPMVVGRDASGAAGAADPAASPGPPPVNEDLIHVSITPFGRDAVGGGPGGGDDMTDLTVLARGGPMWSCGYDDHSLPPVRGRGEQGQRMAAHFAVMSTLTALLARPRHGSQFVDVSMVAAANVTTEFASYTWTAARDTVQRQTGRHASPRESQPTQVRCADGRFLNTGVPPRTPAEFKALRGWLDELGLADTFEGTALLELADQWDRITLQMILEDPLAGEVFGAGREAMFFIASRLPAHDAFVGFQQRGMACGVVWSPDEVMGDPHFVERGFPTEVYQPQLERTVLYPGPPLRFTASPMGISAPAPALGEHTEQVRSELG